MPLATVRVDSLRCLQPAQLDFAPGLNLIHGANGSGKTSLLESIFLCGRGRSFRTRHTERLIAHGAARLQVYAETQTPQHRIGFEYTRDGDYVARLDGEDAKSLAELPAAFFVEVIDPDIHRLIEGGPAERRRWLDWGVFHVEPQFLVHWLRFSRALRQRNAALKTGADPRPWNPELVAHGTAVAQFRQAWLEGLAPYWQSVVQQLSGLDVQSSYSQGWPQDSSLAEALEAGLERDRQRGATLSGPQRADVQLKLGGSAARDVLSRGQQKLVSAALILALLGRLKAEQGSVPTLLLDDPAAELDHGRLGRLVDLVRGLDCQLILTALEPNLALFGAPERVFHVEQGSVNRVY